MVHEEQAQPDEVEGDVHAMTQPHCLLEGCSISTLCLLLLRIEANEGVKNMWIKIGRGLEYKELIKGLRITWPGQKKGLRKCTGIRKRAKGVKNKGVKG